MEIVQIVILIGVLLVGFIVASAHTPTKGMCWMLVVLTCVAFAVSYGIIEGYIPSVERQGVLGLVTAQLSVAYFLLGLSIVNGAVLAYALLVRAKSVWDESEDYMEYEKRIQHMCARATEAMAG